LQIHVQVNFIVIQPRHGFSRGTDNNAFKTLIL